MAKRKTKRRPTCPPHVFQCASCAKSQGRDEVICSGCGARFQCARCGHALLTDYEFALVKAVEKSGRESSWGFANLRHAYTNIDDWFHHINKIISINAREIRDESHRDLQDIRLELKRVTDLLRASLPLRVVAISAVLRLYWRMRFALAVWREKRKKKLTPAPQMTQVPKAPASVAQAQNRKWPVRF